MMRLLHLLLRDRDVDGIRVAALTVGAVFFSCANVLVLNSVHPRGFWQLGVVFVAAVLSLTVLVQATQRLFLVSWARPVLGRWLYESSSGNWGLATIDIRGGDLRYAVALYRTESEAVSASRGEPGAVSSCFATVTSTGVTYRAGEMELIYKIDRTSGDYAPRSGMLSLSPLSSRTMKGYWKSDIEGAEPKQGVLDMYRAEFAGGRRAA